MSYPYWAGGRGADFNVPNINTSNINAQSISSINLYSQNILCSTMVAGSNCSIFGGLGVASNLSVNGNITMNNGSLQYMSNIAMNNGGTVGGVGTINMINGVGSATGTITGVAYMPTAGTQPITIQGYNPSFPTTPPVITIGADGTFCNVNSYGTSVINSVSLQGGAITSLPSGLINNLFIATQFVAPAGDYYGNNSIVMVDMANRPQGTYYMSMQTGESGIGFALFDWNPVNNSWAVHRNYNNNGYQNQFDIPANGRPTMIGYAYFSHGATGNGVSITQRIS